MYSNRVLTQVFIQRMNALMYSVPSLSEMHLQQETQAQTKLGTGTEMARDRLLAKVVLAPKVLRSIKRRLPWQTEADL